MAHLKVMTRQEVSATREHVTHEALHRKRVSFVIPEILYHGEREGRYYLLVTTVPGRTVFELWSSMSEEVKRRCVSLVAGICKELAVWRGDTFGGIDGRQLCDCYLVTGEEEPDFSHENLRRNVKSSAWTALFLASLTAISNWAIFCTTTDS